MVEQKECRRFWNKKLALGSFLLVFSPFFSFAQNNDAFYDKVLNDLNGFTYNLVVDATGKDFSGKLIIDNGRLYSYLNEHENIDSTKYRTMIKNCWKNKEKLILNCNGSSIGFFRPPNFLRADTLAKKGSKTLIDFYFHKSGRDLLFNSGVNLYEQMVVAMYLFDFGIATHTNDESGGFFIRIEN